MAVNSTISETDTMTSSNALTAAAAQWLRSRGIDPETAIRYGVCTTKRADIGGEALTFPFVEDGVTVNRKYRSRDKQFRQDTGAVKCFWNVDALLDPALQDGAQALIITEGEFDALTAIQCGFPLTVSVPDGAPQKVSDEPIDPNRDVKFSFVFRAWNRLEKVKRVIIATDDDGPGRALAQELVRRLGPSRCLFVTYPDNCKDLNDVLVKHGRQAVRDVIANAKPWPVKGLYRLSDYPEIGDLVTFSTGWPVLDPYLRLAPGAFWVVTGIPGHGKSTWLMATAMNVALKEGWCVCVGSFEAAVKPMLLRDLRLMHGGSLEEADLFIERHFCFIDQKPLDDVEDADIDWLIERAKDAVVRFGIKMLIIDPWNEVEHKRRRDETETEYVSRAIRTIKRFAANFGVLVVVVAHPQKMNVGKANGVCEPTLYDISGSANWYNKADVGIVIHRESLNSNLINVAIKKVRIKPEMGREGVVQFEFDERSRKYLDALDALRAGAQAAAV